MLAMGLFSRPDIANMPTSAVIVLVLVIIWNIIWKGMALWKSARLSHKKWFIALMVINTVGILDIIYIYFIANKYKVEVIEDESMLVLEETSTENGDDSNESK